MNSKELTSRWQRGIGASANTAIVRGLQKQESIDDLAPFEKIDNRADFRGWSAGALRGIKGAELVCMDFSYCDLSGVRMTGCSIKDVEFVKSKFKDFVDERNRYEGCYFQGTSFRGSHFGVRRTEFTHCRFERCDFSKLRFGAVEFNQCVFDTCSLKGVDFGASSFAEVDFIGKLEDVWFRGRDPFLEFTEGPDAQPRTNEMANVSFAQAELWDLTFSDNCPLSTVTLPGDGEHYLFDRWQERLQAALRTIEAWDNSRATSYVAAFLPHAKSQSAYILNRNEAIADLGDEVGRKVFATLKSSL